VLAFLVLTSVSCIGNAAEIIVKPGNSIQTAINSAVSGDTIIVKPGTYTENIKITKAGLTIRSESANPDDTIITSRSPYANVFLLQADKVKINGFKISGSTRYGYSGICLSSCSYCTIENNKLQGDNFGIYLLNSKGNKIVQNNVFDGYRGISLSASERNDLSGNTVTGTQEYGIVLQYSIGNVLSGNLVFKNARGIYLGSSDGNTLTGSTVQNNNVYGLYVCGASDRNTIYNNYFNDTSMTIQNGVGNIYNITKTAGTNIVGGPYIGGNYWANPGGTGFSQKAVDKNGDGISDSAYTRITGSRYSDYLPLVISKHSDQVIPDANFWGYPKSGDAPLNVTFTDTSTGKPTAWKWDFGDGKYSNQKNPVHTYSEAGKYTVTLTAGNAAGSDIMTKPSYINITASTPSEKPNADFWGSPKSGNAPLNVAFTDASTGAPTARKWSFGDGTYSTEKNPAHTYSKAGIYTVALTVSNEAGSNTMTKPSYITVKTAPLKLAASFSASPTSGKASLKVKFTDKSTGSPGSWKWSFGDGTYSTQKSPSHTYSTAGKYTVSLTVKNSYNSNSTTKSGYIVVK
jgi:parallel beta-helix repeat protein